MSSDAFEISPMTERDVEDIAALAELAIGKGYYAPEELREALTRSTADTGVFSFVARRSVDAALLGFRITFPPGNWNTGRGSALHVDRWGASLDEAAYFQSCFVAPAHTGRGIGRALAERALDALATTGTAVVIAHSWKESPHRSSQRYLERLGFRPVAECPDYWIEVDYHCPRCGRPCRCTALEMVLKL